MRAVQEAAEQVSSLVRYMPDPRAMVPGSEWTFGETAAHVALGQRLFTELSRGVPSPFGDGTTPLVRIVDEFAAVNRRLLSQFPERNGVRLADLINGETRTLCAELAALAPNRRIDCHFGSLGVVTFASYVLCHLVMHGYPLARALGRPFMITEEQALMAVPFVMSVLPFVADSETARGLHGCIDVRIRGGSRFGIHFGDGGIHVAHGRPRRADCHLSADPVAFLLVATCLVGHWGQIARGRLFAWGRRPWLALKLQEALCVP